MPFLHKYVNVIDNSEKPCCIFQGKEPLLKVRESFLNNEKPEGCSECWRREDNNILSKRQYFNKRFENHDLNSGIKTFDLNAFFAASIDRSTSFFLAQAISPIILPVAGLSTLIVSFE